MSVDDKLSTKSVTAPKKAMPTNSSTTKMRPAARDEPRRPRLAPSSLQDYLIKVTMFLVAIFCSHQPTAAQRPHFGHHQLLQPTNNYNGQLLQRPANLPAAAIGNNFKPLQFQKHQAERRNAGDQHQANQSSAPNNDQGKLLVCYYTSRQSPPYWPAASDPRSYVLAPDSLNSINHQTRDGFSPVLQYEPFVAPANLQRLLSSGDSSSGVKNQQQQLVFKSAGGLLASNNNNNNGFKNKQQYQEAVSHRLANEQHHFGQNNQHQPGLVVAGAKNKQPAYSFVGNGNNNIEVLESMRAGNNNGLIVGGNNLVAAPPATVSAPPLALGNGNNGNAGGFRPTSAATTTTTTSTTTTSAGTSCKLGLGEQNNGHPERASPMKQQAAQVAGQQQQQHPQLVFSPSLSRAFVVGGPNNGNANNEVLDTKSQLFVPSAGQAPHLGFGQTNAMMKGKSLADFQHQPFVAPASSAPSLAPGFQLNLAQQQQQQPFGMQPASTGISQLIIGGPQHLTSSLSSSPAASKQAAGSTTSASSSSSSLPGQRQAPTAGVAEVSSAGASNPTGALASSPLSTMFDVFGAASQYLMRFKPSSLISPSAFVFNTIAAADGANHQLRAHHQHHPHGLKSANGNGSSPTSSLLPLSFSPNLLANMQKSGPPSASSAPPSPSSAASQAAPATDQAGAQLGAGILSRFSLQNNQRREEVCGRTIQTPQRRIIGGEGARYGEFPYQVHIKIAKHQCGGALVDKQSIVTAAHCVYHFITRAPVSKLQIVIGAYDIEDEQYQELPPQYFKVNKVKLHPNFRFSASHPDRYDIAILKLDKPVKYTDNVLPVCLPVKDLKFESMVGTVTGFGKTDPSLSNRYGTRLLQKVDVPIIENNECERWHRTRGIDLKIFPEMMCAGYEDGLKDACVGDSGGPLVVKTAAGPSGSFRWTLAGITSAGFGCAQSRQPGIYHRVSHTVDWILENLD